MRRDIGLRVFVKRALVAVGSGRRGPSVEARRAIAGWPLLRMNSESMLFAVSGDVAGADMKLRRGAPVRTLVDMEDSRRALGVSGRIGKVERAGTGTLLVRVRFDSVVGKAAQRLKEAVESVPAAALHVHRKEIEILWKKITPGEDITGLIESSIISGFDESVRSTGRRTDAGLSDILVAKAVAAQSGLPFVDLRTVGVDLMRVRQLPRETMIEHRFVPVGARGKHWVVAAAAPLPEELVAELRERLSTDLKVCIAPEDEILSAVEKAFVPTPNLRRSARIPAKLRVRYRLFTEKWHPVGRGPVQGFSKNISRTGILFYGPRPDGISSKRLFQAQHNVGVHVFLPGEKTDPLKTACRTVKVTGIADEEDTYLLACRFVHIVEEDARRLDLFRMIAAAFKKRGVDLA